MDANATFVLKDFLSMGYKKTHVTTIISRTDIFAGLPKKHGYAIEYNFNQAVLISIGCELLNVGLSSRHVNRIVFEMSSYDYEKGADVYIQGKYSLLWFHPSRSNEEVRRFHLLGVSSEKWTKKDLDRVRTLGGEKCCFGPNVYH